MVTYRKVPPVYVEAEFNNLLADFENWANGWTPSGTFVNPCTFVVSKSGSDYAASNAYQTIYGGSGDAGGVDGADAMAVIQAALNGLTGGRTWKEKVVLNGVFDTTTSTYIDVPAYTILEGGSITGKAGIGVAGSHVTVKDVTASVDNSVESAFHIYCNNTTKEDIEFINCTAKDCGRHGFFNNGEGATKIVKNVRYINCQAINCGKTSRFNDWITGFDLAESNDLIDCLVIGCYAEGSWESGFHVEDGPLKKNVQFLGCISKDNGLDKPAPTYAAGFVFSSGVSLNSCQTENNANAGYKYENNADEAITISDCKDYRSDNGLVGGGTTGKVVINGLTLFESQVYAVYISGANVHARKLTIINPTGTATICTSFGQAGFPLTDSTFEIFGFDGVDTILIYVRDGSNLYFTGALYTGVTPFFTNNSTNIMQDFRVGDYITRNSGNSTGTGAQQTLAHGCNFTPTASQVFLSERTTGDALPKQTAAPNDTNIYITAVLNKDYNWKVDYGP